LNWYLSKEEYAALVQGGEVLKRQRSGVKVWRLPDDRIVKLFRPKGWLTRDRIYPPGFRFARNARRLERLGIHSVIVQRIFFCPDPRCHGVVYPLLPGVSLDGVLGDEEAGGTPALMRQLAEFVAALHELGILFRSLHPGNVILRPDGTLGLIDVQELRFHRRALGVGARVRNFRHLLRRPEAGHAFANYGLERFVEAYLERANLTAAAQKRLRTGVLALKPGPGGLGSE
jgi:serine/threonine protein kinase